MADQKLTVKQLIARGVSAWERDEYKLALTDFREVLKDHPHFPDIQNKAGLCLAMLEDPEASLQAFDRAVEANPTYAEAHLNRAIILNELGRYDEAQEAFNRAAELDRKNGGTFPADLGNRVAIGHARLGDLYLELNQPDRAAEEYRQALEFRPHFADIRFKLADALITMGQLDEALEALKEIVQMKPRFTAARIRLGAVHLRLGEREEAIEEWLNCAEQNPEDRRVRAYLASAGHGVALDRDGDESAADESAEDGSAEDESVESELVENELVESEEK